MTVTCMRKIFTKTKLTDKITGMLGSETAQSAKTIHHVQGSGEVSQYSPDPAHSPHCEAFSLSHPALALCISRVLWRGRVNI